MRPARDPVTLLNPVQPSRRAVLRQPPSLASAARKTSWPNEAGLAGLKQVRDGKRHRGGQAANQRRLQRATQWPTADQAAF